MRTICAAADSALMLHSSVAAWAGVRRPRMSADTLGSMVASSSPADSAGMPDPAEAGRPPSDPPGASTWGPQGAPTGSAGWPTWGVESILAVIGTGGPCEHVLRLGYTPARRGSGP
eukprot:1179389-Prorocentrum_minimum.AAC.2